MLNDRAVIVLKTVLVTTSLVVASPMAAAQSTGAASVGTGSTGVVVADSSSVVSGYDLYRENYCGLCHTLDRAGTAGVFGPTHNGLAALVPERLHDVSYSGIATTAEEYVRESITHPDVYIVPGFENTVHRMPPYTHLKPEAVDAIVKFLLEDECAVDVCSLDTAADTSSTP